ncbi:hypothetical protein, partial [Hyalangium sp.]|uniref:hypothetical protein n=1 Tax=Hyalangium sp. TaxID=2028555 RepID=UPI002D742FF4
KTRLHNFYAPDKICACNVELLVRLEATPEQVERVARPACEARPEIRKEPAPKVWLVGMTPLFQLYIVKIWIDDFARHDDIESDLLKALFQGCHAERLALGEGALPALAPETDLVAAVPPMGKARVTGG